MAHRKASRGLDGLGGLLTFSGLVIIAIKPDADNQLTNLSILSYAAGAAVLMPIITRLLPRFGAVDKFLTGLVQFIISVGIVALFSIAPISARRQLVFILAGCALIPIVAKLVRWFYKRSLRTQNYLTVALAACMLVLILLPTFIGQWTSGAKNWISVPIIGSMQPSEFGKVMLIIILSVAFSRARSRLQFMLPLGYVCACILILFAQRDLGAAVIYGGVALIMYYAATNDIIVIAAGMGAGIAGGVFAYNTLSYVRDRVSIWINPWADMQDKGYQIVQALMAIASGSWFGLGLGLGQPRIIPAYMTDFIFAVICEQFGVLFGVCLLAVYAMLVMRAIHISLSARTMLPALLAMCCAAMLGLQTFIIVGGVIKLIPITGVTLPFISYGGSSMISSMIMIGILQGVAGINAEEAEAESRRV